MKNNDLKKVLILRLSALGDTIHTLPLAHAIKKAYPECKIGWVVEDKASLFIKNNPLVDYCYVIPRKKWKKRGLLNPQNFKDFFAIISEINSQKYDMVLDVQQLFKSASLLPFMKIKRKISLSGGREFSGLFSNEVYPQKHSLFDSEYHVVKRNLELAKHVGADETEVKMVLPDSNNEAKTNISKLLKNLDLSKKTVVLSPATTWDNKHWEESCWSEVLDAISGKVNVVFTGMDTDNSLIGRIIAGSSLSKDMVINLAGKTNLEELAEVFRRADVVVSPDSGSAHIAWAVSKPSVVTLFFATAEKRNAPYGDNCYVLTPDLPCRPCFKRKCKLKTDKNKCCKLLESEKLISLLFNILQLS